MIDPRLPLSLADGLVAVCSSLGLDGLSSGSSSVAFLRCIGREESFRWSSSKSSTHLGLRFNLADFFAPRRPRGVEFSGPLWSPARLFINLANWSFVFVVPILYAAIYKFRKAHAVSNIGE